MQEKVHLSCNTERRICADMIPTVGFNMHKVDKGKVSIKVWDLGGQKKFRSMWERYCRKNDAIVYVISYHVIFYPVYVRIIA